MRKRRPTCVPVVRPDAGFAYYNPAESPEEVSVTVGRDTVQITTDEGRPLVFAEAAGAGGGLRPPWPALIPPGFRVMI